jgi:hypothetical protein
MKRKPLKILRFVRRQSRGVTLSVRKTIAAGGSVVLALAPAASGFFLGPAEAKARTAAPQLQSSSSSQCTRLTARSSTSLHSI